MVLFPKFSFIVEKKKRNNTLSKNINRVLLFKEYIRAFS